MMVKRLVVVGLESVCGLLDHVTWRHRCYFANLSDRLDQRWGTSVWFTPHE